MRTYIYISLIFTQIIMAQNDNRPSLNYHNRNCTGGVGFCSDDGLASGENLYVKFFGATPNKLIMAIPKSKLSIEELNDITNADYFEVSGMKSFKIPTIYLEKSAITIKNTQIPIGTYPIKIEKDSIKVFFTISRSK